MEDQVGWREWKTVKREARKDVSAPQLPRLMHTR